MTSKKTPSPEARQATPDEKKLVRLMFIIAIIGIIVSLVLPQIY